MPIVEYPFLKPVNRSRFRPMLHIRISNPTTGQSLDTIGLIDTGADTTAAPASFASLIGHNLQAGQVKQVGTGNGISTAYAHTCTIEIFDTLEVLKNRQTIVFTLPETPVDFMPNLHTVLLGVDHFLSCFVLSLDYPKQVFSIRKPYL